MNKFLDFINDKVAPKLQKIASNPYIAGIQSALLKTMPMILVSSIVTIYNYVIRDYIPGLPDLGALSNYTFGLLSMFMSFLVPYYICENKKHHKGKFVAAMTGLALYMILVNPAVDDAGRYCYTFSCFGAGGMFVAIVSSLFTAFVFNITSKINLFKEDSELPDFITEWFDTIIPVTIVIFVGWLLVIQLKIDLYTIISNVFMPFVDLTNSLWGCLFMELIMTIFYSMGISGWVFTPVQSTMCAVSLAANAAAVAAGLKPEYVFTDEWRNVFVAIGGRGVTFMLVIYCCLSKSKKLKAMGKTCFIPNLMNINEPIVFGTIAWNPLLMVPMWIANVLCVLISYLVMKGGLVPIPYENLSLWYLPGFITSIVSTKSFSGLILFLVNLGVSAIVWYPFFKAYEKKCLEEEATEE